MGFVKLHSSGLSWERVGAPDGCVEGVSQGIHRGDPTPLWGEPKGMDRAPCGAETPFVKESRDGAMPFVGAEPLV